MRHSQKVASILEEVAQKHEVTVEEIKSKSSLREFTEARVAAAQELYKLGLTMREMAVILNRTKHSIYRYLRKPWTS